MRQASEEYQPVKKTREVLSKAWSVYVIVQWVSEIFGRRHLLGGEDTSFMDYITAYIDFFQSFFLCDLCNLYLIYFILSRTFKLSQLARLSRISSYSALLISPRA